MADAEELAWMFKVLSVGARVRIVQLLRRRSLSVTALTSQLCITQAATSQHLRILRDAGLVKFQKRGFHVYYQLDKRKTARLNKTIGQVLRLGSK
jgi:DNA-binding transcriptional ArsR family regulator